MEDNEDQNDNESEVITVKPSGVPEGVAVTLVVALLLAIAGVVYYASHQASPDQANKCAMDNATIKAQLDAQKSVTDYNAACAKRDGELRLAVIKACVDRGNLPVFLGGNIDCKVAPK